MAKSNLAKLVDLIKRYQYILWGGAVVFALCLAASLWIYYHYEGHPREGYWFQVADFLRTVAETIVSTVLIGGGLGGIINFIFEEQKKEEEAVRERVKNIQEIRERRKAFRSELRRRLQEVYDNVELARVLIKSHRSGKTYGEQIRNSIMPANITLQDIKQQLIQIQEENPMQHLAELQVSLTYMSAYLSVLVEEFSRHYLDIAMLQNYQDTVSIRRRDIFTDLITELDKTTHEDPRLFFLRNTETRLEQFDIPDRLAVVWDAMGRLDYVWDFIADLRDEDGKTSLYQTYFVDHHFHCFRILRNKDSERNERICRRPDFVGYLTELERLTAKKDSDQPITKHDSLTRTIMVDGLGFDFEVMGRKGKG